MQERKRLLFRVGKGRGVAVTWTTSERLGFQNRICAKSRLTSSFSLYTRAITAEALFRCRPAQCLLGCFGGSRAGGTDGEVHPRRPRQPNHSHIKSNRSNLAGCLSLPRPPSSLSRSPIAVLYTDIYHAEDQGAPRFVFQFAFLSFASWSTIPNLFRSQVGIVDFSQNVRPCPSSLRARCSHSPVQQAVWLYCSPSVTELLGWEPGEIVGTPSIGLTHPDEEAAIRRLH